MDYRISNSNIRSKLFSIFSALFFSSAIGSSIVLSSFGDNINSQDEIGSSSSNFDNNPRFLLSKIEITYGKGPGKHSRKKSTYIYKYTGDNTPYVFSIRPLLLAETWNASAPYPFELDHFSRLDALNDKIFYALPHYVYDLIDEPAVSSITQYYRRNIQRSSKILDIGCSWVSHYPLEFPKIMKRISGMGMNELELHANNQLTDYIIKDLNIDPKLPYRNNSFSVVTCVMSMEYFIHPVQVLKEVYRVLSPGGKVIISHSNQYFPTKVVNIWQKLNFYDHLKLINSYFHYANGFEKRVAYDITVKRTNKHEFNPIFIIVARKLSL